MPASERDSEAGSPRAEPAISVVIPTYHRHELLERAVRSVVSQALDTGALEVVIARSDANDRDDRAAAEALSAGDPRVRHVASARPGPGAARNAGMQAARAPLVALLDDDCVAGPGWLQAGVEALAGADLVQGTTLPIRPAESVWDRVIHVDHMTWLWEACNLFVRAEAVARAGGFDEDWNPTGVPGRHFGEDVEWGWRLVHQGARAAYSSAAVARHAVEAQTYSGWLLRRTELRWFPLLLRVAPELRHLRFEGPFFNRRHRTLVAAAALAAGGACASAAGARRGGSRLAVAGAAVYLLHLRHARSPGEAVTQLRALPRQMLTETVEVASLMAGSVRWRRVLL